MTESTGRPRLDLRAGGQRTFLHVLLNTLLVSVVNFTLWFALTFWVFLETRSVFATGLIGRVFLVAVVLTGIWFGSLVDHHRKKAALVVSTAVSLVLHGVTLGLYLSAAPGTFRRTDSVAPRVFVVMFGVVAGNVRTIASGASSAACWSPGWASAPTRSARCCS